jgi:hypothetical protein
VTATCSPATCENTAHDHFELDDSDVAVPMLCSDCDAPAHYDYDSETYCHDDPDAPDCFMIRMTERAL